MSKKVLVIYDTKEGEEGSEKVRSYIETLRKNGFQATILDKISIKDGYSTFCRQEQKIIEADEVHVYNPNSWFNYFELGISFGHDKPLLIIKENAGIEASLLLNEWEERYKQIKIRKENKDTKKMINQVLGNVCLVGGVSAVLLQLISLMMPYKEPLNWGDAIFLLIFNIIAIIGAYLL